MYKLYYASLTVDYIVRYRFLFCNKCFIMCIHLYSFCILYVLSFVYFVSSFPIKGTTLCEIDTLSVLRLTGLVHIVIVVIITILLVFLFMLLYKSLQQYSYITNFTLLHIYIYIYIYIYIHDIP